MTFEVIEQGDARMWRGQNLREERVDIGEAVKRTCIQRVYDVAGYKAEKEAECGQPLRAEKISKSYEQMMVLARSSEKITSTFVDTAVTVHRRLLLIPSVAELLQWCDEFFVTHDLPHPFQSVYAFQGICDRTASSLQTAFAIELLIDHYRMGFINLGSFAVKKIRDARDSYVCVCNYKMEARTYLLGQWLDTIDVDTLAKKNP